ncbi:MarR family winged helix-turn-helix transcriptional regulator [Paenibacillus sp. TAB 01]|uniref:MarR family winged helix-turn-helix transcriptional regulator n=1 Tax=Paenibacillus sp. TAB 01 TaxID=3368988 RepID=UPI0037533824
MDIKVDLIRSIYLEIREIHRLYNKQSRKVLVDYDITMPQLYVLRYLLEMEQAQKQVTITDLILKVDCSPSSMSIMIQRLEQEGMVNAVRGIKDRREVFVTITEKGKQILYPVELSAEQFIEERYKDIESSELQALYTSLQKFKRSIE